MTESSSSISSKGSGVRAGVCPASAEPPLRADEAAWVRLKSKQLRDC